MKFFLVNDFGFEKKLPLQSSKIIAGNFNTKFCIDEPNEDLKIFFNGVQQNFSVRSSKVILPFIFDDAGNCNIQLECNNFQINYKVEQTSHYKIENVVNCEDFLDFEKNCRNCADNGKLTVEDLFLTLRHGDINLLRLIDPLTGLTEDKIIDEILRAMPYALEICSKPHQHLRIEQEILDVELVKRITPDTLKHLAAHSEHWKARTITGLIPDRLLAQTFEDELNIYENIFFRMAIQKALEIVETKEEIWRKALAQKNAMVAWEYYGNAFNDPNRMRILQSIMPKAELLKEMLLSDEQELAKSNLDKTERHLLSISSSNFYTGLNKNISITLPIFPTNILTMDSRYREIYIMWNKMQRIEKQKSVGEENAFSQINSAYFLYVFVLLLYGLHLIHLRFSENSFITFDDNNFNFNAEADSDFFYFKFTREIWRNLPYIKISMTSKKNYIVENPFDNIENLNQVLEKFPNFISVNDKKSALIFKGDFEILNSSEMKNIFKQKKGRDRAVNRQLEKVDKIWQNFLNDAYRKKPSQKNYTVAIVPLAVSLGDEEFSFCNGINNLFDSLKNLSKENFTGADTTIFVIPFDVYSKFLTDINNPQIENRLINYGEKFFSYDSQIFGNYKFGLIPVTMTDVNSIQRLIKIIKMHMMKNYLEWDFKEKICPYCGSENIYEVKGNLWQCEECKITWGDTQCANENCKKKFKWIRPPIDAIKIVVEEGDNIELLLRKENMFGLTTIVDFDFDTSEKDIARYIPRCPYCGYSNVR